MARMNVTVTFGSNTQEGAHSLVERFSSVKRAEKAEQANDAPDLARKPMIWVRAEEA